MSSSEESSRAQVGAKRQATTPTHLLQFLHAPFPTAAGSNQNKNAKTKRRRTMSLTNLRHYDSKRLHALRACVDENASAFLRSMRAYGCFLVRSAADWTVSQVVMCCKLAIVMTLNSCNFAFNEPLAGRTSGDDNEDAWLWVSCLQSVRNSDGAWKRVVQCAQVVVDMLMRTLCFNMMPNMSKQAADGHDTVQRVTATLLGLPEDGDGKEISRGSLLRGFLHFLAASEPGTSMGMFSGCSPALVSKLAACGEVLRCMRRLRGLSVGKQEGSYAQFLTQNWDDLGAWHEMGTRVHLWTCANMCPDWCPPEPRKTQLATLDPFPRRSAHELLAYAQKVFLPPGMHATNWRELDPILVARLQAMRRATRRANAQSDADALTLTLEDSLPVDGVGPEASSVERKSTQSAERQRTADAPKAVASLVGLLMLNETSSDGEEMEAGGSSAPEGMSDVGPLTALMQGSGDDEDIGAQMAEPVEMLDVTNDDVVEVVGNSRTTEPVEEKTQSRPRRSPRRKSLKHTQKVTPKAALSTDSVPQARSGSLTNTDTEGKQQKTLGTLDSTPSTATTPTLATESPVNAEPQRKPSNVPKDRPVAEPKATTAAESKGTATPQSTKRTRNTATVQSKKKTAVASEGAATVQSSSALRTRSGYPLDTFRGAGVSGGRRRWQQMLSLFGRVSGENDGMTFSVAALRPTLRWLGMDDEELTAVLSGTHPQVLWFLRKRQAAKVDREARPSAYEDPDATE